VECNEKGVCTEAGGLDKAAFVKELARAILLSNARLMAKLDWPPGATQTAFKGVDYSIFKSPSSLASAKIDYDSAAADKANVPVTAPTRMPTPAPTATPTTQEEGSYGDEGGSYPVASSRRLLESEETPTAVDTADMPASQASSRRLQVEGEEQEQPLEMDSVWDAFYVVRALPTQCMFSFKKSCKIITVDIKDNEGRLAQYLLQAERSGHFSKHPVNMQYAQQADTLDANGQIMEIMWTVVGFIGFAFLCLLVYKVYKSFTNKTTMTEEEKKAFRASQQIW